MDPETLDTLVAAASALCIMVLLYGAWVCLDHLAAGEEPPTRPARPPRTVESEPREDEA